MSLVARKLTDSVSLIKTMLLLWVIGPVLMFSILHISCKQNHHIEKDKLIALLPKPAELSFQEGEFLLNPKTRLIFRNVENEEDRSLLSKSLDFLRKQTDYEIREGSYQKIGSENSIILHMDASLSNQEQYSLSVGKSAVELRFSSLKGAYWGIQTLRQLLPSELAMGNGRGADHVEIPNVRIEDYPNFAWRGVLLDLGGRYLEMPEVLEFIDIMSYFKLNLLHLRLSHNTGWRIAVDKYPELVSHNLNKEKSTYYDKEELLEIIEYAHSRGVEIIPEVSFPNQAKAASKAYPALSCIVNSKATPSGVYCPSSPATLKFAEAVIGEIAELFPGKFIHLGGDRVNRELWSKCERCTEALSKNENKDLRELQVQLMDQLNEIIGSHDKQMIAWDENKEYGFEGEAIFQFWRDFREEQTMNDILNTGAPVIASPMNYTFFHLDSEVLSLYRAYRFNPYPPGIKEENKELVKGAECVLYAGNFNVDDDFSSYAFPKLLAFSERLWSPLKRGQYRDFYKRMEVQNDLLRHRGVKVGPEGKAVVIKSIPDREKKELRISAYTWFKDASLHYSTDGSEPSAQSPLWEGSTKFDKDINLKFKAISHNQDLGSVKQRKYHKHLGIWAHSKLLSQASKIYDGKGAQTLNDGERGTQRYWTDLWLGYRGEDLIYELEWDEEQLLSEILVGSIYIPQRWIYLPSKVVLEKVEGNERTMLASFDTSSFVKDPEGITYTALYNFKAVRCKKVQVRIVNHGKLPNDHPFQGEESWTFCDEIVLR